MPDIEPFHDPRPARTATRLLGIREAERHVARDFGWFWEITDDVDFITTELYRIGRVVNVWETPQFKAIERVAGRQPLSFPAELDAGLHGAFCRILSMEAICRRPMLPGDIADALVLIEKASKKMNLAADDLHAIRTEVVDFLRQVPPCTRLSVQELEAARAAVALNMGAMTGVLQAQMAFQRKVYESFSGQSPTTGRPANWVARFIVKQAADIYRTVHRGPIAASRRGERPSFFGFLQQFCEGYPEAETSEQRRLGRQVLSGAYPGAPFAPI